MLKISIKKIEERLKTTLIRKGINETDARVIAEDYLSGELQEKESHGLMAFPSFLKSFVLPKLQPEIILKTHSLLVIDAHKHLGAVVGRNVADQLCQMAKNEGVAAGFIKNMTTWLRPGSIAEYIAKKDMVGIVMNNGGRSMVAPPGGFDPVIGTNPIGIGIPMTHDPIIADMATAKRAWGEVRKAERFGNDLPPQTYFDNRGEFASKPQDAYSVIATGDYKGFAIGLLIEILSGSFIGRDMGKSQSYDDYRTLARGGVIIVLDPSHIQSVEKFKNANTKLVNEIKNSRKRNGVTEILLPGEKAQRNQKKNLENGYLKIEESLWESLRL